MPDILVSRPHALGLDAARRAVDEVADRLREEFGVATRREGETVYVEGRGVTGHLHAGPHALRVEASLGLRARPFKRLLRREIEAELDRLAPLP
jgi:putative polyhydroxyalkanoate system protein